MEGRRPGACFRMAGRHRRHKTTDVNEGPAPSARLAAQSDEVENLIQFHQESISEKGKTMLKEKKTVSVTLYGWRVSERAQRSSRKEHKADALALRADERRDKLRKAAGRSKYPVIRGCLNGETRQRKPLSPYDESIVIRREPGELKHLSSRRKRKKHRFPE